MNNFTENKRAFGAYLKRFYDVMLPTHAAIMDMKTRGAEKSLIFVPDRMIDAADEMLSFYRENSTKVNEARARLPVVLVSMSKDANPSMADYSSQAASPSYVQFPSDERNRAFKLQVMVMERRAQLAFFGAEETSIRSLATQFVMWAARPENRRFTSSYALINGVVEQFPISIESSELMASSVVTGQKNITLLTIDMTLRESTPFLTTPESEKGVYVEDSDGYKLVTEVIVNDTDLQEHQHVTEQTTSNNRVRHDGISLGGAE